MPICFICENDDQLQKCPNCKNGVCSLCLKYDCCDMCLKIQLDFQIEYEMHKKQIEEQNYQLNEIQEKLKELDGEINLVQRAEKYLEKQKSESLDYQLSETLIDKQHELEDLELEIQTQQELNQLQSQQLKLQTQNQKLDLRINEAEKEHEILQDALNLKKQQIYQILQTLKNKTSLIRGSYDVEKHYSQSRLTLTAQQQKPIQSEEEKQNAGLCAEKCMIQ